MQNFYNFLNIRNIVNMFRNGLSIVMNLYNMIFRMGWHQFVNHFMTKDLCVFDQRYLIDVASGLHIYVILWFAVLFTHQWYGSRLKLMLYFNPPQQYGNGETGPLFGQKKPKAVHCGLCKYWFIFPRFSPSIPLTQRGKNTPEPTSILLVLEMFRLNWQLE